MKKFIFLIVALLGAVNMYAQQTVVEGSRLFDNTYIGVSVGGQVGMTDIIGHDNWTVAPTASLYFGKWFTPAVGLELNGDVLFHDGFSTRNRVVDATYVGLNGRLNLNNLFHKYRGRPDRVEVIPFVGLGWLHGYGDGVAELKGNVPTRGAVGPNALGTKMGIDLAFNLGERRAWALNLRPYVAYALTGYGTGHHNPIYNVNYGRVGVEFGFTHKFGHKNSKGERTNNFVRAYTVAEYDAMVARLSNVAPDTVQVVTVLKEVERVEVEKVVDNNVYVYASPYFARGNAKLDLTALKALDVLAGEIKEDGKNYVITGYASVEGENDYNQNLSLRRATVVRDALIERGVDGSRLTVYGGGPTDRFGEKYEDNRTAVINEAE